MPIGSRGGSLSARVRLLMAGCAATVGAHAAFAQPAADAIVNRYYSGSREAPRPQPPVAAGKPNVLWILLDDTGFGASSAFGGMVPTPVFDSLANGGLRYTNFHDTGVCAPTRASLLTGRNHHRVGMGLFPHIWLSAGFPGYSGFLQPEDGTVAEYLRDAGYGTYALGKWHLTPDEEASPLGPFDRWPTGKGFQHYYGFLGGSSDQYRVPDLMEDTLPARSDGRHLNAQLVDKAIAYIDRQKQLNPKKPFFMYFATGATHSPHQVDAEWRDRFRGAFDEGWDAYRTHVLARQKALGIVPPEAELTPRDPEVPAWETLSADQKRIYTRFMESFAGYLAYTDHEIGRLVDHLRQTGQLDNTMIVLMIGDNGGSREGGYNGTLLGDAQQPTGDDARQIADLKANIAEIGTAKADSNFPIGWSQATNTPFREWKASANAEGGTRNPMILYWKGRVQPGIRSQYTYVTDMLPTTMELVDVPMPTVTHGITQHAIQGVSFAPTIARADAPSLHTVQYYFLFGSGGVVQGNWKASFDYRPEGWMQLPRPCPLPNLGGKERWELYDLKADFNERRDLAGRMPAKVAEMKALFEREAAAEQPPSGGPVLLLVHRHLRRHCRS